MSDLKELYYNAFEEGGYEFPALFLSAKGELKYSVKFPLYVSDEETYAIALNKAMMLCSYDNGINEVGLFAATDEGTFLFVASQNKITLYQIIDGVFEAAEANHLDSFSHYVIREYLSVYSRKDYTEEVIETLQEQGFEVNAF